MSESEEFRGYDEEEALTFIVNALGEESELTTHDRIYYVINLIWDYYQENGLLDIDMADDEPDNIDLVQIADYIRRRNRKSHVLPENFPIKNTVKAELDYENSLEDLF